MNDATSHPTNSLWLAMAPPTAYPALDGDLEFDAAVIGGGIAGVSVALALKRDGARGVAIAGDGVRAATTRARARSSYMGGPRAARDEGGCPTTAGGAAAVRTARDLAEQTPASGQTDVHALHPTSGVGY